MKTFTQTSDKPYDRHHYKVGNYTVKSWEEAVGLWQALRDVTIEVIDKPKKGGGGF